MGEIIIDADKAVLGRLASFMARQALLGNKIIVVNSEKAVVTGSRDSILNRYLLKRIRGASNLNGPFYPMIACNMIKRTARNMLPYKQERGRTAYKSIRCYNGIPKEYENAKKIKSGIGKKGMTLETVSKLILGRKYDK